MAEKFDWPLIKIMVSQENKAYLFKQTSTAIFLLEDKLQGKHEGFLFLTNNTSLQSQYNLFKK